MALTARIKDNFSKAALNYENYADIQKEISSLLLEKVLARKICFKNILDIGCGTGSLIAELKSCFKGSFIAGLDISFAMAQSACRKGRDYLVADAEGLPFKKETFDLVVSNAAYQWVGNLENSFKEARDILKDGGYFIFSCFGPGTLKELRDCFKIEQNPLPCKELIYNYLKNAGFKDIGIKTELRYKYFDNLTGILCWLKNIGANRINPPQPYLAPGKLAGLNKSYRSNYRNNGKVYASFEVIWVEAVRL